MLRSELVFEVKWHRGHSESLVWALDINKKHAQLLIKPLDACGFRWEESGGLIGSGVSMPLSCDRDSARSSLDETTPCSVLERDETVAVSRGPDPPQPALLITTVRLAPPHVPYLVTRSASFDTPARLREMCGRHKHALMRFRTCSAQGRSISLRRGLRRCRWDWIETELLIS